jgi:hypothetical protein
MHIKHLLACAIVVVAFASTAPQAASALEIDRGTFWRGSGPDPYAYRYEPPAYYPYYGSSYWRPAQEMRYRYRYPLAMPEFYPAWGYPLPCQTVWTRECPSAVSRHRE